MQAVKPMTIKRARKKNCLCKKIPGSNNVRLLGKKMFEVKTAHWSGSLIRVITINGPEVEDRTHCLTYESNDEPFEKTILSELGNIAFRH